MSANLVEPMWAWMLQMFIIMVIVGFAIWALDAWLRSKRDY